MGKVTLVLDDKLENDFRKAIYESKGMKRGNIQSAIEEAIECWIKSVHEKERLNK